MVNFFYLDKDPYKCAQYYCDKHVNKIMIELAQMLSYVHYEKSNKKPPYKKTKSISINLAPLKWIMKSTNNYKYAANLATGLLNEYKYRYNKEHKCEKAIIWLNKNIPLLEKKNRTKFKFTKNVSAYGEFIKDSVLASRYMYVDFKCKKDKWTKRNKPYWFDKLLKDSNNKKNKLIKKIMINVRDKLPKIKNNINVNRFHSFLRICYDNLFEDKWDKKIKTMKNMFDPNKPLIYQLGLGHLLKVFYISNLLFNSKNLNKLNNKSLKYRKKI